MTNGDIWQAGFLNFIFALVLCLTVFIILVTNNFIEFFLVHRTSLINTCYRT